MTNTTKNNGLIFSKKCLVFYTNNLPFQAVSTRHKKRLYRLSSKTKKNGIICLLDF